MSEDTESGVTAPTSETHEGAENNEGLEPMTQETMAKFFNMPKEPGEEEQEPGQEDPSEESSDSPDPENASQDQQGDEEESEEEPVLSNRAEKRIKNLLSEREQARQEAEELRKRIEALEKGEETPPEPEQRQETIFDLVNKASSQQDLAKLAEDAKAARRFARQHLHEEYVEVDGKEMSHDEIVSMLETAEQTLEEFIPQRNAVLQQQSQFNNAVEMVLPGLNDPETDTGKFFSMMRRDPLGQMLETAYPNGRYLLGALYLGSQEMDKRMRGKVKQPQQQQGPSQQKAQVLPGMNQRTAPNRVPPSESQARQGKLKELSSQGTLSKSDLEAFFNQ